MIARSAPLLLQQLALDCAMEGAVEGAACLLDAVLYLADPDSYTRVTSGLEDLFIDHWIRDAVRGRAMKTIRVRWVKAELDLLRRLYHDTPTKEIAMQLGRKTSTVWQVAGKLGLHKSAELIAREAAENMRRPDHGAKLHFFPKGHVPMNKGARRPGWAVGRMAETQFRKGEKPHTWLPLGSERLMDGYLQRKMTDTGYPPRDWRPVHVMLWEEHYGPVPKGHTVKFKDGNKTNIAIENLELLSRAELMLRNTIHNLPKDLVEVIQLNGVLKRRLRTLEKNREEQNVRSA